MAQTLGIMSKYILYMYIYMYVDEYLYMYVYVCMCIFVCVSEERKENGKLEIKTRCERFITATQREVPVN